MSLIWGVASQFLNVSLLVIAVVLLGAGLGSAIRALLLRTSLNPPSPFQAWLLGSTAALVAVSLFGLVGIQPLRFSWVLFFASLVLVLIRAVQIKPRLGTIRARMSDLYARNRNGLIGGLIVLMPFLPLFRFGPTTWTLISNDFTLFSSWLVVWESDNSDQFLTRHPDAWGHETLQGAKTEKPVAIGALGLLGAFSFGSVLENQTSFFLLVVMGTYVLLWKSCQALMPKFPLWASFAVAVSVVGLYPWARVLHASWGHMVCVYFLAAAIYWTSSRNRSLRRSGLFFDAAITGFLVGVAFGANAELVTLLAPTVLVVLLAIVIFRRQSARPIILSGWFVGAALSSAYVFPGALVVLNNWRSIPQDQLGLARAEIPFPSPLGLLGLQPTYDSMTQTQVAVLWCVAIGIAVFGVHRLTRRSGRVALVLLAGVAPSLLAMFVAFGSSGYATGKYVSALVPLLAPFAIVGVKSLLSPSILIRLVFPIALTAVAISLVWSYLVPIVVPRDLMALRTNSNLESVPAVNIDLGNYYENNAAAQLIPAPVIYVVDEAYGGRTAVTAPWSLVRYDASHGDGSEELIRLNQTYALIQGNAGS